jgi:hypothetical protein
MYLALVNLQKLLVRTQTLENRVWPQSAISHHVLPLPPTSSWANDRDTGIQERILCPELQLGGWAAHGLKPVTHGILLNSVF